MARQEQGAPRRSPSEPATAPTIVGRCQYSTPPHTQQVAPLWQLPGTATRRSEVGQLSQTLIMTLINTCGPHLPTAAVISHRQSLLASPIEASIAPVSSGSMLVGGGPAEFTCAVTPVTFQSPPAKQNCPTSIATGCRCSTNAPGATGAGGGPIGLRGRPVVPSVRRGRYDAFGSELTVDVSHPGTARRVRRSIN